MLSSSKYARFHFKLWSRLLQEVCSHVHVRESHPFPSVCRISIVARVWNAVVTSWQFYRDGGAKSCRFSNQTADSLSCEKYMWMHKVKRIWKRGNTKQLSVCVRSVVLDLRLGRESAKPPWSIRSHELSCKLAIFHLRRARYLRQNEEHRRVGLNASV